MSPQVGCASSTVPEQSLQLLRLSLELPRIGFRQALKIHELPSDAWHLMEMLDIEQVPPRFVACKR